ncbi:MAG: hypothetical protein ACXWRA_14475 [Pseudobdellovibrionaceae bacterium]
MTNSPQNIICYQRSRSYSQWSIIVVGWSHWCFKAGRSSKITQPSVGGLGVIDFHKFLKIRAISIPLVLDNGKKIGT